MTATILPFRPRVREAAQPPDILAARREVAQFLARVQANTAHPMDLSRAQARLRAVESEGR